MSCYLIEELLPLYIEGDTSTETNKIVAEHLHSCESCRHLYQEMKEPISLMKTPDPIPYLNEKEEKRKFEKRYYGKLLCRASIVFSVVYVIMIILYWLK
ncbi:MULTISPECIES: anti-sigma factor family protein [Bacillus]|uniref:anti-sigma factor family protein n=1 Tax=Bacillus TaxID=1386 RepID=UPI0021115A40|nr:MULTISPECIES: zf-HC2 domain-containing protein [Bacillus]MED1749580.1 zf-HC2 domain-containing protein [Bacillus zhangzhouensis]UUD43980.1 zf-HC2 domain-containing protein [Bacillus pumilus]